MQDGADQDGKRGTVTDENRAESFRLLAIWKRKRESLKDRNLASQGAFGAEFGIGTQGAVWQYLHGRTAISLKAAHGFAKGLQCRIGEFSERLAALAGEDGVAPSASPAKPPAPPRDFADRREVSDTDWQLLEALKYLPQEEVEAIRARALQGQRSYLEVARRLQDKTAPPTSVVPLPSPAEPGRDRHAGGMSVFGDNLGAPAVVQPKHKDNK